MDSAGEAAGVGAVGIGVCAGAGADVPAGEQAAVISTAPQAPAALHQADLCLLFGVVISNFLTGGLLRAERPDLAGLTRPL
jgi:hypothetical protein